MDKRNIIWGSVFAVLILICAGFLLIRNGRKGELYAEIYSEGALVKEIDDISGQKLEKFTVKTDNGYNTCLLYTSPSPRDSTSSRMPSSA